MARKVSLYIEDTEIKLLVTNGNQVEKWASLMLDAGLVSEGVILDENRVAESIKQIFKLQQVSETSVEVGISGLNSVFRIISIPRGPQESAAGSGEQRSRAHPAHAAEPGLFLISGIAVAQGRNAALPGGLPA